MHVRIRADEDMPSHFFGSWPQQGQRALSHLPQRHIICPVVECPETNLEFHSWYRGEADFRAVVRVGKLIKAKPIEEICYFLSAMYWYAVQ